jgi:hypothetical protein
MSDVERPKASKGGRPASAEPSVTVCSWVPASDYDRLCKLASERGVSVSALVRARITRRRDDDPDR